MKLTCTVTDHHSRVQFTDEQSRITVRVCEKRPDGFAVLGNLRMVADISNPKLALGSQFILTTEEK